MLKILGPNTKRETKIGVNKSAKSDTKYVDMLANEIVQQLVDKYMSGHGWKSLRSHNVIKCTKV